jgi:hypothetical protein
MLSKTKLNSSNPSCYSSNPTAIYAFIMGGGEGRGGGWEETALIPWKPSLLRLPRPDGSVFLSGSNIVIWSLMPPLLRNDKQKNMKLIWFSGFHHISSCTIKYYENLTLLYPLKHNMLPNWMKMFVGVRRKIPPPKKKITFSMFYIPKRAFTFPSDQDWRWGSSLLLFLGTIL